MGVSATTPTIYHVTLTDADTEYSQTLPANLSGFTVQAQTSVAVRFAFVTGKVATPTAPYGTIKADGAFSVETWIGGNVSDLTLYLASGTGGTVVEIVTY